MKRYDELTHEELIILKEEDIERLIDLEIAHEGIMPVSCPVLPTLEEEGIVKTEIAHKIGNILLKNEEDALAVAKMPQFVSEYDYSIGYDYKWLDPFIEISIAKEAFYKQSDVVRIKEILQRNKIKREEYEKQKSEYDGFLRLTGKIRDKVYAVYYEALRFQREIDEAKIILEKYRNLAEGNEDIAIGFFKNTYKERTDIIEKVLGIKQEVAND